MANKNVVLAHGILGFGNLTGLPALIHYFNGVAPHLKSQGHNVLEAHVNPIGSVAQRGDLLAREILGWAPNGDKVHVIAHSMGGLDARHAITNVAGVKDRVATLVTIGTPHRGSPVADAIANRTGPLLPHVPTFLVEMLRRNAGGLHDLTTAFCRHFDAATADVPNVRYVEIAGDASKGGHELFLFQLAAIIGKIQGEINDGVVTKSSALRAGHEHPDDWPVDHAGEVGWDLNTTLLTGVQPRSGLTAHLAPYDDLVAKL